MDGEYSLSPVGFLRTLITAAGWILTVVSATEFVALPTMLKDRSQSLLLLLESFFRPSTMSTSILFATSQDPNSQLLPLCPSYGAFLMAAWYLGL